MSGFFIDALLAAAVAAIAIAADRRHRRLRRRLARLERRIEEHVMLFRAIAEEGHSGQFGEDILFDALFADQATGFFIEAGANDGRNFAGTAVLERRGWTGLLVEPLPDLAEQCRANRPRSETVHAALGRAGSKGTTPLVVYTTGGPGAGLVAHLRSARHSDSRHPAKPGTETVEVPLVALADLLNDREAPIDLLVLDVEGAEADALDGLNLRRYRPRLIFVEDHCDGASAVARMLRHNDYLIEATLGHNLIAIESSETALLERLRALLGGRHPEF